MESNISNYKYSMNEFMDQYWSFYSAGVAIFLFAGFALVLKLIFFKRKRKKKEPHLTFKHWNHRFENDFEHLEREMHAASFLPKDAAKLLKKAKKKDGQGNFFLLCSRLSGRFPVFWTREWVLFRFANHAHKN